MEPPDGSGRARNVRLLGPLHHREFRLLWIGMSTSLVGDGVLMVGLVWQVYALTGSPAAMSAVGVALSLPQVATLLFGGVLSDRLDRRRVMLCSDLVRAASLATLAVLTLSGGPRLWQILVIAACHGAAAGFFGPAFDGLVPELVEEEGLVAANAIDQFVRPTAMQIVGPALGGALIAVSGVGWAFALDALTFTVSVGCLLAMRRPTPVAARAVAARAVAADWSPQDARHRTTSRHRAEHLTRAASRNARALARQRDSAESLWAELGEGLRYVRGRVWLWGPLVAAALAYLLFLGPTEVLLPYLIKNVMGGGAGDLGLVLTSGGLGAIAAALAVGRFGLPRRYLTFMYLTWAVATFAVAGYGFGRSTWQLAVACALVNGFEAAGTVAWATLKQRLVPTRLLGRVSSVDWFVSTALLPLSYALTAPVAEVIGVRQTLVGAGVLGGVVTFAFLFLPGMRAVERASEQGTTAGRRPAHRAREASRRAAAQAAANQHEGTVAA